MRRKVLDRGWHFVFPGNLIIENGDRAFDMYNHAMMYGHGPYR